MTPKKHNRFICLLSLLVIQSAPLFSQGLQKEWTREFSLDPAKANTPVAALVAPDGTLVVAGTSQSTEGDYNYEVIKYRSNGEQVWRATFASAEPGTADAARGMAIDANGNIIVTGTTSTVKFNGAGQQVWNVAVPGRAVVANAEYIYVTGISDIDIVTAQLSNNNTDGEENWRRIFDGEKHQTDIGHVITLDVSGNIYVGGQLGFGCSGGQCDNRFAVVSYTASGIQRFLGNSPYGGPNPLVQVFSIVVLDNGSPALFGTQVGQGPLFTKFSATGTFEWGHNYGTIIANYGAKMIRDPITGDFVISGRRYASESEVDEAFVGIIKQDRTYERIWSYSRGPTIATDIVQDSKGNFIVVGRSEDGFFSSSLFIARLTRSGQQIGVDHYAKPGNANTYVVAAAVDAADNAYVIGYTVNSQGGTEWVTIKYSAAPKIEQKPSGAMHLEFHTLPGRQYSIEGTTNFLDWQNLVTANADANGVVQYDDTNAPTIPYRFYRGSYFP